MKKKKKKRKRKGILSKKIWELVLKDVYEKSDVFEIWKILSRYEIPLALKKKCQVL